MEGSQQSEITPHQPSLQEVVEASFPELDEFEEEIEDEEEEYELPRPRSPRTPRNMTGAAHPYGRKRPMPPPRPNLEEYFDEFEAFEAAISHSERIRMCRAYASYLASLAPPVKRQKK